MTVWVSFVACGHCRFILSAAYTVLNFGHSEFFDLRGCRLVGREASVAAFCSEFSVRERGYFNGYGHWRGTDSFHQNFASNVDEDPLQLLGGAME